MVSLKTLKCPRCGASVKLDDAGERANCPYCGTVSYTDRVGHPGAPIVVVKSHTVVLLSLLLGVLAVITACIALLSRTGAPATEAALPAPLAPPREAPPVPAPEPAPKPEPEKPVTARSIASYAPARLIDSDGDGNEEVLVPIERVDGTERSARFAVYALPSLELVRETAALTRPERALVAAAHNRLLLAQPAGELEAYDLASGDRQWTSALGERVAALCAAAAKEADALHVVTDDGRNLLVDVKTGRQSATRTPCPYPLAVATGRHAPGDRRDYRALRAMRAYLCGGVRVMGSQNYQVPDACRAQLHIDSDRLDGMVAHAIWDLGARSALVFGVRKPGTYVPTVGVREGTRWRWKHEVPLENPLAAEQGGPRVVSLAGDSLLIAYADERRERHWVTRFDVRDGTRSWTTALPSDRDAPATLLQSSTAAVVHTNRGLYTLDATSGAVIRSVAPP